GYGDGPGARPAGTGRGPAVTHGPEAGREGEVYAGPGARRLARDLEVDLAEVRGTGHKGRITKEDVRAHHERALGGGGGAAAPGAGLGAGLPAWPQVDFARFGPVETVELSRIRRIAGPNLARNWIAIPHVTQHDEADVTELEAFRREVNAAHADAGVKVTMVSLLLKACASTLRAFPEFNSSLDGDHLVLKRYTHLGFAADTPQGLMVPVVRDVDRRGLLEIARELTRLSQAARDGKLAREDMQGGTFTISSLGGIGGTAFTPIINAPEVAILGVSRMATKPVWTDGEFRPRLMLPLSLSYDHRVIDGAAAARFTTHLAGLLRDPRQMLL
ncbi:MAG TPA: 2-oxo acid dehydrogenase subunit E2, partial [Miltoncostaeaceae bacterium]|nr:2-oxo acid dehydrogenase subunit E2 [Miltoncostaeaceae bacterium]